MDLSSLWPWSWTWLLVAYQVTEWTIRIVMTPVILRRRMMPARALMWLTVIFLLPLVGIVLYLILGVSHLGRQRARVHQSVVEAQRQIDEEKTISLYRQRPAISPQQRNMILQAERIGGHPIVGSNQVDLVPTNDELTRRMIDDIDHAQHHVHQVYYIWRDDEVGRAIAEALIRAARRGVTCRMLVDSVGSRPFLRSELRRRLAGENVRVQPMLSVNPFRRKLARIDLRNHRKISVIDGQTAYAGSHNIVVESYGTRHAKWIDLSARFTGPSVLQLQQVFLDDWEFETGEDLDGPNLFPPLSLTGDIPVQIVPTGPSYEAQTFRRVLISALNNAEREIMMTSPYFVPDEPTMLALSMAAERGVKVTIIMPQRTGQPLVSAAARAYFEPMIEAGVHIYRFQAGALHSKTITVDDAFAMLGSANLDIRSFYLNFELSALLYGPQSTAQLRFAQCRYLSDSIPVELKAWRDRPVLKRYGEQAAALMSPLL